MFEAFPESTIQYVERELGAVLPRDYKRFMVSSNGAIFDPPASFSYEDKDTGEIIEDYVGILFGLAEMPLENELLSSQIGYDFNERVPNGVIAIGVTTSGSGIATSLRDKDFGVIYVWDPLEAWVEENVRSMDDMTVVAPSFSAFLDTLEQDE